MNSDELGQIAFWHQKKKERYGVIVIILVATVLTLNTSCRRRDVRSVELVLLNF